MRPRRTAKWVDSLIDGGRPRSFDASDEDVALLRTAITLREARGAHLPSRAFVSELLEELAAVDTANTPDTSAVDRSDPAKVGGQVAASVGRGPKRIALRPLAAAVAGILVVTGATTAIERGAFRGSAVRGSAIRGSAVHNVGSLQVALLDSSHRNVGEIRLLPGAPSWVFMNIAGIAYDGRVICQLEGPDGSVVLQRTFDLNDGSAAFARDLPIAPGKIRSGRIVTPSGEVLASATFGNRGR